MKSPKGFFSCCVQPQSYNVGTFYKVSVKLVNHDRTDKITDLCFFRLGRQSSS